MCTKTIPTLGIAALCTLSNPKALGRRECRACNSVSRIKSMAEREGLDLIVLWLDASHPHIPGVQVSELKWTVDGLFHTSNAELESLLAQRNLLGSWEKLKAGLAALREVYGK